MSALVLDTGALLAVERNDRAMIARLRVAQQNAVDLRSNAMVIAQVWRTGTGRQTVLARTLPGVDVRSVDQSAGRAAGRLLAAAGTRDAIDATVALLAEPGDRIATSDPADLAHLLNAANIPALIVVC
jgi:hypothetical protein